jgi:chorismate mutase
MQRVYAVRGAIALNDDTREDVVSSTQQLLRELLAKNDIAPEDIVSIFFTATDDVHAEFPAAAARLMGLNGIPLLCAREMEVTSSLAMPKVVRILMHIYADRRPEPVYLNGTERLLRPPDPA